jgi:hypothetical protein
VYFCRCLAVLFVPEAGRDPAKPPRCEAHRIARPIRKLFSTSINEPCRVPPNFRNDRKAPSYINSCVETMANATPATCKVFLAGTIAQGLLAEVKEGLARLGEKPKLVGFLANGDPAAQVYADYCAKTCYEK